MNENTKISQKIQEGDNNTQIGVQYNYGITPEEASKMAIDLFLDNFPKLKKIASDVARERVDELVLEIINKLNEKANINWSVFSEPDMQYILFEAEKGYARLGNKDRLNILSELIINRMQLNEFDYTKIIVDKSIEIVNSLNSAQIDFLSLSFIGKQVKFNDISSVSDINNIYGYFSSIFTLEGFDESMISYLYMLGCFELNLGTVLENISKIYNIKKEEIENILPPIYNVVHADYKLSQAAIIIAITNLHKKTKYKFDINTWVPYI